MKWTFGWTSSSGSSLPSGVGASSVSSSTACSARSARASCAEADDRRRGDVDARAGVRDAVARRRLRRGGHDENGHRDDRHLGDSIQHPTPPPLTRTYRAGDPLGRLEHLAGDRLHRDAGSEQAGRDSLDDAPFPDRFLVETRSLRQPGRALAQVAFERVLAHDDAEVVLGLGEQPVRVDQLEAVGRFERVPLVDVAVHEDGPVVPVRLPPPLCALECVVDRGTAAGPAELVPHRGDESTEAARLLLTGRQAPNRAPAATPAAPRRRGSRAWLSSGSPSSDSDRPSRSSRSAPRSRSSRSSRAQPSPPARRSAVASCAAASPPRGTISLRTAGEPSAQVASATKASVENGNASPTVMRQSASISPTSSGSASSHSAAPTASAFSRTTSGTSST